MVRKNYSVERDHYWKIDYAKTDGNRRIDQQRKFYDRPTIVLDYVVNDETNVAIRRIVNKTGLKCNLPFKAKKLYNLT